MISEALCWGLDFFVAFEQMAETRTLLQMGVVLVGMWIAYRLATDSPPLATTAALVFGAKRDPLNVDPTVTSAALLRIQREKDQRECLRRIGEAYDEGLIQWLNLHDVPIAVLPQQLARLEELVRLHIGLLPPPTEFPDNGINDSLGQLARLREVLVHSEMPLTTAAVDAFFSLPSIRRLSFVDSRLVVDDNYQDASGSQELPLARSHDILRLTRTKGAKLKLLELPAPCRVVVAHIHKVFLRAHVAVVEILPGLSLALHDRIVLERIQHEGLTTHRWQSDEYRVDSIRTDDHEQLSVAEGVVAEGAPGLLVSIPMPENGRKGDRVVWVGVDRMEKKAK